MASGSLTVAAVRHRPRQAVLVVMLAAVVGASAVLGPLYARAAEQSVLRTVLAAAPASQRGVVVTASGDRPPSPAALSRLAASVRNPQLGRPVGGADTPVTVEGPAPGPGGTARLTSREGICGHLPLTAGRCRLGAPAQVLVSRRSATALGVQVGDTLRLSDTSTRGTRVTVTVAGIYGPINPAVDYWFDRSAAGQALPARQDAAVRPVLDAVFTSWRTIHATRWSQLTTHADVPMDLDALDLVALPQLQAASAELQTRVQSAGAVSSTALTALLTSIDHQRKQSRTVVLLLAVQLALLGLVVLGLVGAAATEARRPEIALARLRGLRSAGAAGLLLRELGALVAAGAATGAGLGWFVGRVATDRWLAPGVHLEWRWPVTLAVLGAGVAGLLAVALAASPTLRQPVVALLRRVPPRSSALQVGIVESSLVALSAAGFVTLLSGGSRGPLALLAPGLLAVAGGLLIAALVVPVSRPLARSLLRRGRLPAALASTQVARRPALRRLIAVITVACALLVFAVDTWAVASHNRDVRAGVEAGAPVVLTVSAPDARTLRTAVLDADPRGRYATPVVTARSGSEAGPRTTAVQPQAFGRIARWGYPGDRPPPDALHRLHVDTARSVRITGDKLDLTIRAHFTGVSAVLNGPAPPVRPLYVDLHMTSVPDGTDIDVELAKRLRRGRAVYPVGVPCSAGCLLRGVGITRDAGGFDGVDLHVMVQGLRAGPKGSARTEVDLGPPTAAAWQPVPNDFGEAVDLDVLHPLSFAGVIFGTSVSVQRGDVPVRPPALVVGDVGSQPVGAGTAGPAALAPDLRGLDRSYGIVGRLPRIPRTGVRGALVDLNLLDDEAGPATTQTTYAVWLGADDPARESRLRHLLARRAIDVTGRDTIRAHEQALAAEGPSLALRLSLLAGVIALVLAAAVLPLGIATSGRARARDLAGLRTVGVPLRVVRSAAVREHVTVALLGTVSGVLLGLVAAQAALPRVPLFAQAGPRLPTVRDPAWAAVAASGAGCLVLLVVVAVLVGRSLAAAAAPTQLRDP